MKKYSQGFVQLLPILVLALAIPLFVFGAWKLNFDWRNRAASGEPTPTPVLIPCKKTTDCPKSFTCISGHCQPQATPTPKPTPTPKVTPTPKLTTITISEPFTGNGSIDPSKWGWSGSTGSSVLLNTDRLAVSVPQGSDSVGGNDVTVFPYLNYRIPQITGDFETTVDLLGIKTDNGWQELKFAPVGSFSIRRNRSGSLETLEVWTSPNNADFGEIASIVLPDPNMPLRVKMARIGNEVYAYYYENSSFTRITNINYSPLWGDGSLPHMVVENGSPSYPAAIGYFDNYNAKFNVSGNNPTPSPTSSPLPNSPTPSASPSAPISCKFEVYPGNISLSEFNKVNNSPLDQNTLKIQAGQYYIYGIRLFANTNEYVHAQEVIIQQLHGVKEPIDIVELDKSCTYDASTKGADCIPTTGGINGIGANALLDGKIRVKILPQSNNDPKTSTSFFVKTDFGNIGCANMLFYGNTLPQPTSTPVPQSNHNPTISAQTISFSYVKHSYSLRINGSDVDGDKLNMLINNLPPGLSKGPCAISASKLPGNGSPSNIMCSIVGTPTKTGLYRINVVLTDSRGGKTEKNLYLVVLGSGLFVPTPPPTSLPTDHDIVTPKPKPTLTPVPVHIGK